MTRLKGQLNDALDSRDTTLPTFILRACAGAAAHEKKGVAIYCPCCPVSRSGVP